VSIIIIIIMMPTRESVGVANCYLG